MCGAYSTVGAYIWHNFKVPKKTNSYFTQGKMISDFCSVEQMQCLRKKYFLDGAVTVVGGTVVINTGRNDCVTHHKL